MKALNQQELENFVSFYSPLLAGAQLQDIVTNDRGLALGFQGACRYWLILDLVPNSPMMLVFQDHCPFRKGAKPKPVGLFLNSHGKNLIFSKMSVVKEMGRVVQLTLINSESVCEIEVRLIPKQCNLLVKFEKKQIAWDKPIPLSPPPVVENLPEVRALEFLQAEWLAEQSSTQKNSLDPEAQWEKKKKKDLEKKSKALEEIKKQIESDQDALWAEAGVFLKTHGHFDLPENLRECIKEKESLSWNIENCFAKSKQYVAKKVGARERLQSLTQEIEKLEKARYSTKLKKPELNDLMSKAEAKGRKLHLRSGALAYCGRSASDNLALLRQAKSWDFWLHLRDYPGAHAIIHRQRDQLISDLEIEQVSEWLAKESLASRSLSLGQKVNVVIVECRFVRPIKGDKLGRVNYHSEKTLSFILK